MKKILISLLLASFVFSSQAQIIKSNSVNVKVKESQNTDGKQQWLYLGLAGGGCDDYGAGMVEFNYLRAISGTFDDNVVPYVGGGVALGYSPTEEGIYLHIQPMVGAMLGGTTVRFDIRLAPTLYVLEDEFRGCVLVEPGVWFGQFHIGAGVGWDFDDGDVCGMFRLGLSF